MKVGLCLSGGGIKGAAHIGVLKALEEKNIKLDMISGASSGSIVAALYALGYKSDEIYMFFKKYAKKIKYADIKNIFKLILGLITKQKIAITGLTSGEKLKCLIEEKCLEKNIYNINDVKIPIFITSVDLKSGNTYIFTNSSCSYFGGEHLVNEIPIATAVRASCSFPGVFEPIKWGNCEFIDGGVRENIPWRVLQNCGMDKVITVVFQNITKKECCNNMFQVLDCSFKYLSNELFEYEIEGNNDVINIETEGINLLDFTKVDFLYRLGYERTIDFLNKRN